MKLYELTDKGRVLLLEKELKKVKKELQYEKDTFKQRAERWWNHG